MFTFYRKKLAKLGGSSGKGITLIEVVIAMLVAGILVAAFLTAIRGSTTTLISVDEKETAKNLAESQMEYVKKQGFLPGYSPDTPLAAPYQSYNVAINTSNVTMDNNLQKITVIVSLRGTEMARLTGYKVK